MKVLFSVLLVLMFLSGFAVADVTCVQNCTYNWTINTTQISITTYNITLWNISNITIVDSNIIYNLTSRIADLQANVTLCQNRVTNELSQLQNTTGYAYLVGVIQNQTSEIAMLKIQNQMLANNVSIYSDGYSNFQACIATRDNAISEANNRTAAWQKQYQDQQQTMQTYIYVGVALVLLAYFSRPTIEKFAKDRFGGREIGERRA